MGSHLTLKDAKCLCLLGMGWGLYAIREEASSVPCSVLRLQSDNLPKCLSLMPVTTEWKSLFPNLADQRGTRSSIFLYPSWGLTIEGLCKHVLTDWWTQWGKFPESTTGALQGAWWEVLDEAIGSEWNRYNLGHQAWNEEGKGRLVRQGPRQQRKIPEEDGLGWEGLRA